MTPWTIESMGFSRPEYWSGYSLLQGIFPTQESNPGLLHCRRILWPPDLKNWLIGKDPDADEDWRQEEKGTTEDEMVGWNHQLDGHEFEQALGVDDRQRGLMCCSPWGHKESVTTKWLNWTETHTQCPPAICLANPHLIYNKMVAHPLL